MTNRRQWTLIAGIVMTVVFGAALVVKLRPELALVTAGSRAPAFGAVDLRANRPVSLADYRGQVLLINIWATWCAPCRAEMPSMERVHRQLAGTDFRILAVSVDQEGGDVVMAFVNELGLTFDILHDQAGAIQGIYQTTGVPESFLVDRDGDIVKRIMGPTEWDSPVNAALIRRLLDAR